MVGDLGFNINFYTSRILYKLKLYRELANLSQGDFSNLLSVSLRTYQRIEAGEAPLDIDLILKISQYLNISIGDWLSCEKPSPLSMIDSLTNIEQFGLPNECDKMITLFRGLNSVEDFYELTHSEEFKSSPYLFYLSHNTKKIANDSVLSEFEIEKKTKITEGYKNPYAIIQYLDFLFYFRPSHTFIHKVGLESKNNNHYVAISFHHYFENNLFILSILKEEK